MNRKITIVTLATLVVILTLVGACKTQDSANQVKSVFGDLKLVAQYKPLRIYIYADPNSTREHPKFIVREEDTPIYISESTSNQVEITHFEKSDEVLATDYDKQGRISRREVSFYAGRSRKYSYIDTNGDGLFDFLIKGDHDPTVFTRSNLCWVLRYGATNQPESCPSHN